VSAEWVEPEWAMATMASIDGERCRIGIGMNTGLVLAGTRGPATWWGSRSSAIASRREWGRAGFRNAFRTPQPYK
jgi:hypothetical protein